MRGRSPGAFAGRLPGCLFGRCALRLRQCIPFVRKRGVLSRRSAAGSGSLVARHRQVHAPCKAAAGNSRKRRSARQADRCRVPGRKSARRARLGKRNAISGQLVEKEIKCGNPAIAGNDEISPGVSRRLTRAARYPPDPPAIPPFSGLGSWLISKVWVSGLDRGRDAVDLVAATVDSLAGIEEHAIFGVEVIDGRAPALGIVFTEDVAKIADQQGRYAVRHGLSPLGIEPLPSPLTYRGRIPQRTKNSG